MPMAEMGQGIYTAMAMLLAEELEVGLDQVRLEHAPPDDALYANSILHIQTTGLSSSIRVFWTPLRQAGAVGRTLLIEAAAKQWGVDPRTCRAQRGVVLHSVSGRRLGYGQFADAAAALPVPPRESVTLKQPKDFTLIGTAAKRLDSPDKVNGRAGFGIDARVPGMKIAAVAISPVFGGRVKSLDGASALAVRGVHQVVRTDEAVAVVADHMWAAKKGLKAAAIQWDDGPNATVDSATIIRQLEQASKQPGVVARDDGDASRPPSAGRRFIAARKVGSGHAPGLPRLEVAGEPNTLRGRVVSRTAPEFGSSREGGLWHMSPVFGPKDGAHSNGAYWRVAFPPLGAAKTP
jgi:isoquinoline 1-oxidoreductase subunit beta